MALPDALRLRRLALILPLTLGSCTADQSRSPTCGLALLAGPTLIQQQLHNMRAVLTDPPRGLPDTLPARVIQQRAAQVLVSYARDGQIVMGYQGPGFPAQGGYGLLVVDDTSQRAMGVLIYESEEPKEYPKLGTVSGTSATLALYGVRIDWASVSNPRCPLLGPAPASASPSAL